MADEEGVEMMAECYAMGHDVDFGTGRNLVIDGCADLPAGGLARLCRAWGANIEEVQLGIAYQRSIEAAAARMLAGKGVRA